MKWIVRIVQLAFALTFIFSGVAKCIDPMGTSIKFNEYLLYFGWDKLCDLTMGLAWLLSIMEFCIGFSLLVGRARNQSLTLAALMMLFFTPLTLWLAVSNAIQDCGCFGDALHLTNWETFWKNIVLDVMLILLIGKRKQMYELIGKTNFTFYFYWNLIVVMGLCWMGTFREPVIDFRPYHPGVDMAAGVLGVQNSDLDAEEEVTYTCVYERNGERKEFPLEELPDEEDGWEFVETIEHHATASDQPSTTDEKTQPLSLDFFARTPGGELFTEQLLSTPGYTILLLSPSLDKASQHDIDRIEELFEYSQDRNYPFYCLTSRDTLQVETWKQNTGAEYPFLFTDMQIVETITRANPGVMLLHNGVLCWKENLASLDVKALVTDKLDEQSYGEIQEIDYRKRFLALMILLFGPMPLSLCFEIPKLVKFLKNRNTKNHQNNN